MKKVCITIVFFMLAFFIIIPFFKCTVIKTNHIEKRIISMVQEVINEKNYFLEAEQRMYVNSDINYQIYYKDDYYYVVFENNSVFAFILYDDNLYYIGHEDYKNANILCKGNFKVKEVYAPNYYRNKDAFITSMYNPEIVCQSIIKNNFEKTPYTIYILNKFPWDKSNYLNGTEIINIMIVNDDRAIFTYCFLLSDGWHIGSPTYSVNQSEYSERINKYKETSIYKKST